MEKPNNTLCLNRHDAIIVKNIEVWSHETTPYRADLLIENGTLACIEKTSANFLNKSDSLQKSINIDGSDQILIPAGVDPQVHLRVCLLYTSPSPRDKRQSRMPSSA